MKNNYEIIISEDNILNTLKHLKLKCLLDDYNVGANPQFYFDIKSYIQDIQQMKQNYHSQYIKLYIEDNTTVEETNVQATAFQITDIKEVTYLIERKYENLQFIFKIHKQVSTDIHIDTQNNTPQKMHLNESEDKEQLNHQSAVHYKQNLQGNK